MSTHGTARRCHGYSRVTAATAGKHYPRPGESKIPLPHGLIGHAVAGFPQFLGWLFGLNEAGAERPNAPTEPPARPSPRAYRRCLARTPTLFPGSLGTARRQLGGAPFPVAAVSNVQRFVS
jgi:hypothetical protein